MALTSAKNSGLLLIISAAALSFSGPCVEAIVEYDAYNGIECDDVTLHSYNGIATPEACQAKCDVEWLCRAFSFSLASRECYLKKDCSEPRKQDGFVSAVDKTIVASTEDSQQLLSPRSNELIVDEAGGMPEDAPSSSTGDKIVVSSTWTFPSRGITGLGSDNHSTQIFRSSLQTSLASAAGVLDEEVSVVLLEPGTSTQARVEVRFPSERDVAIFAVQLVSAPSSLLSAETLQNYGPASVTNIAVTLDILGDLPAPPPPSTPSPTTPAPTMGASATPAPSTETRPTPATAVAPTPSPTAASSQAPSTAPTPAPTPAPTEPVPTTLSSTTSPTAAPTSSQTTPPAAAPTPAPANQAETPATAPLTLAPVSTLDEGADAPDNQSLVSEIMSPQPHLLATTQHNTPPPPGENKEDLEPSSTSDGEVQSSALIRIGIFGGTALIIMLSFGAAYYLLRKREQERSLVKEVTFDDGISAMEDKDIEGHGRGRAQAALQQLGTTSADSPMWGVRVLGNIRSSMDDGSIASSSLSGAWHEMLSRPGAAPAWGRERSQRQSLAGTVTGSELAEGHRDEAESSRLLPPRWWGGPGPWWVSDSDSKPEHPLGI